MRRLTIPDGKIHRAVAAAIKMRETLIADGMAEPEVDRVVGEGLKAAWTDSLGGSLPNEPWYYVCEKCKDNGVIVVQPSYMELKRLTRMYGENPQDQDYMAVCDPCAYRDRERTRRQQEQQRRD